MALHLSGANMAAAIGFGSSVYDDMPIWDTVPTDAAARALVQKLGGGKGSTGKWLPNPGREWWVPGVGGAKIRVINHGGRLGFSIGASRAAWESIGRLWNQRTGFGGFGAAPAQPPIATVDWQAPIPPLSSWTPTGEGQVALRVQLRRAQQTVVFVARPEGDKWRLGRYDFAQRWSYHGRLRGLRADGTESAADKPVDAAPKLTAAAAQRAAALFIQGHYQFGFAAALDPAPVGRKVIATTNRMFRTRRSAEIELKKIVSMRPEYDWWIRPWQDEFEVVGAPRDALGSADGGAIEWTTRDRDLIVGKGAGHTFTIQRPFIGSLWSMQIAYPNGQSSRVGPASVEALQRQAARLLGG